MANGKRQLPGVVRTVRLVVLAALVIGTLERVSQGRWYETAAGVGGTAALVLAWRFLDWLCPGQFCTALDLAVSLLVGQGIVWGTLYHGYDHYAIYDTLTHFLFGMVLAWAGVLLLFRQIKASNKTRALQPGWFCCLAFLSRCWARSSGNSMNLPGIGWLLRTCNAGRKAIWSP